MNCERAREQLPGLVYGDLSPDEAAVLAKHLAGCPACRREQEALRRLHDVLQRMPAPAAAIDLPRLYAQAQRRRLRRWRWTAAAAMIAAAVLLGALAVRVEVRVRPGEFTLRWGGPARPVEPPPVLPPPPAPRVEPPAPPITAEEVRLLRDLIHALADDVDARDQKQQEALARLESRLAAVQSQAQQRLNANEQDVGALYTAQFGPRPKGANP